MKEKQSNSSQVSTLAADKTPIKTQQSLSSFQKHKMDILDERRTELQKKIGEDFVGKVVKFSDKNQVRPNTTATEAKG